MHYWQSGLNGLYFDMDKISSEQRSRNMAQVKGKDTKPEKLVRTILHGMGYRFRLHNKLLPGKPDIVLPKYKAVVFVNGCFWHGHEGCKRATMPATRLEFWQNKIAGNRGRDSRNLAALENLGYHCLVVWQCELKDLELLKQRLSDFLDKK
jgi:DNA mismatch endonuclease (patch repair protein)